VLESLRRYHDDLHGENPSNIFLWDQQRQKGTWCPKEENAVSDHIAQHLDRDLRQRGVVVNREVVIRRKPGQRTDIHVDAVDGQERLKVIIEVKGCWNPQVATAMQDQLKDRYLRENECSDGIYLVAWFDCPSWDPDDRRCADAAAWCSSIEEARKQLGVQARDLSTDGCSLAACVLDGRL